MKKINSNSVENLENEEVIRYEVKPHMIRKNMEVVSVFCSNELICTFYMHSKAGRRFAMVISKHLVATHVENNPIAPGVIIDLGEAP